MRPTDILMGEHRVILQVLNCLETLANQAAEKGYVDYQGAGQALDFFHNFADRCHHNKEESHLFACLEKRGFLHERGPTEVMRWEHKLGRNLLEGLARALAKLEGGHPGAVGEFVHQARDYVHLMRTHIFKEDQYLFPMANQALNEFDQNQLLDEFAAVESHEMDPEAHDRYLHLANDLADRLHIPRVFEEQICCCHHAKKEDQLLHH